MPYQNGEIKHRKNLERYWHQNLACGCLPDMSLAGQNHFSSEKERVALTSVYSFERGGIYTRAENKTFILVR